MPFEFNDVEQLRKRINTISKAEFERAYRNSLSTFPLLGLVKIDKIDNTETSFKYTPQTREYMAADASPATCHSEPNTVEMAEGDEIKGFTNRHELSYEICKSSCKEDLLELIRKKERVVAIGLLKILSDRFWLGNPSMLQYGITNHPAIKHVQSEPDGTNGSTKWAYKSNNQVMKVLRTALRNMNDGVILMSEGAYDNSLGNADDCNGNTCSDKLRSESIENLLTKQATINFKGPIGFSEELDNHPDFDGKNIAIVYDRDSLALRSSGSIWQGGVIKSSKIINVAREINTSGLQIDYYDSVIVIIGI